MSHYKIDEEEVKSRNLPYLNADSFTIHNTNYAMEVRQYLRDKAQTFCDPVVDEVRGSLCVICRNSINSWFTWGLIHGQGYCGYCEWPYRLYHYVDIGNGKTERVVAAFAYHPDLVFKKDEDDE